MRVLIVDDELIGRESLKALLTVCDFEVQTASDGHEAIEIAENNHLDAVMIDWILGHSTNGLDVAKQMREIQPSLHIVIISGQPDVQSRANQNNFEFLPKPFQLAQLMETLQSNGA